MTTLGFGLSAMHRELYERAKRLRLVKQLFKADRAISKEYKAYMRMCFGPPRWTGSFDTWAKPTVDESIAKQLQKSIERNARLANALKEISALVNKPSITDLGRSNVLKQIAETARKALVDDR